MNYLSSSEYQAYGLEASVSEAWVGAASALMDAHCRRATLGMAQYTERMRVQHGVNTVRLSYLPVAPVAPSASAITAIRARYAMPRRSESLPPFGLSSMALSDPEFTAEVAAAFGLPGQWTTLNPATVELCGSSGELTLPIGALGLGFNEVEVTYTAGCDPIPDVLKFACVQIVRNAQATPALNVRAGTIDRMHLEYFSDTLVDSSVRVSLAPYVAQKVA